MFTIYHYADNGEYIGQSEAMESPLEPGVILIPRHATEVVPPDPESGFTRVFDGRSWTQVIDRRGTRYWVSHSESVIITDLGIDIPDEYSIEQPAAPPDPVIQPTAVKAWQGVLWLGIHGHIEPVNSAIEQMAPPLRILARMCMSAPDTVWKINDGITQQILVGVLGMTQEEIQDAFTEAGAYTWPA